MLARSTVAAHRLAGTNRYYRRLVRLVAAAVLTAVVACATTPEPLAPETRTRLGHVAVVALPSAPNVEFHTFAKGWAAGAAKGGAQGLVNGLLSALVDLNRNPPSGPYAGVFTLVALVVEAAAATVVYGVAGGIQAVPADTAEQLEGKLHARLGDVRLADDLAERIHAVAAERPELAQYAVTRVPASAAAPALDELARSGVDTLVEVQITDAGFRGGSRFEPDASFYLSAHLRLLATATGEELYTRDFQFLSRARPFENWFVDGSRALTTTFAQAMASLADRISDELFMTTSFPFASGILALPGKREFGSCWFYPVDPAVDYTSLWYSMAHNEPGIHIHYSKVESVDPLLRWEPFPRPRDRKPDNASVLNAISDVTYDLKIWEAQGDFPERLMYDVRGLDQPEYRPTPSLKPATKYFWTFRARYQLAGRPQVTRWAFSNLPSNAAADWPQRPAGGSCELDAIPAANYYRFATP